VEPEGGAVVDAGVHGWPLLVVLHAYGTTGEFELQYLGLDAADVRRRYALVLPHGNMTFGALTWRPQTPPAPPWDSAYVRAVIADALATAPLDPRRVYVVGGSQGAQMAHRVACDSADLVSAVVSVVGQLVECSPSRPVSALELHGTADVALPYRATATEPGAVETISVWGQANGCTGPLATTATTLDLTGEPGSETVLKAFSGCPPGIAVELATMNEAPHHPDWTPNFTPFITGFLEAHARP
jgi:polyhydroxybutyrate depolymerase